MALNVELLPGEKSATLAILTPSSAWCGHLPYNAASPRTPGVRRRLALTTRKPTPNRVHRSRARVPPFRPTRRAAAVGRGRRHGRESDALRVGGDDGRIRDVPGRGFAWPTVPRLPLTRLPTRAKRPCRCPAPPVRLVRQVRLREAFRRKMISPQAPVGRVAAPGPPNFPTASPLSVLISDSGAMARSRRPP